MFSSHISYASRYIIHCEIVFSSPGIIFEFLNRYLAWEVRIAANLRPILINSAAINHINALIWLSRKHLVVDKATIAKLNTALAAYGLFKPICHPHMHPDWSYFYLCQEEKDALQDKLLKAVAQHH